jgi:polyhydroxybutyrate depolymerase
LVLLLWAWLLVGVASASAASDETSLSVDVRDVSPRELVQAVCETPSESLVRFVDLDSDGLDEAVVSAVCGDPELTSIGVFVAAPEFPILVDTLATYHVRLDDGAPPTLTAVGLAPPSEDDEVGVVESGYTLIDRRLQLLAQRPRTTGDYFTSVFHDSSSAQTGYVLNPHLDAGDQPLRRYIAHLPSGYDPGTPAPLLIGLHSYGATPGLQENKMYRFRELADERGWIYVAPYGLLDGSSKRYWNATDACCDYYFSQVDDVAYISSVIDEVSLLYNVDPQRVFVVGHSNGGFMAHRLACDLSDRITAVVSIAGAQWLDPSSCSPTSPVSVLEIHGDSDTEVSYQGGFFSRDPPYPLAEYPPYPSASQTVAHWARLNGCGAKVSRTHQRLNLDLKLVGRETRVERFKSCSSGGVELWTIEGGEHIPFFYRVWAEPVFEFLANAQP